MMRWSVQTGEVEEEKGETYGEVEDGEEDGGGTEARGDERRYH